MLNFVEQKKKNSLNKQQQNEKIKSLELQKYTRGGTDLYNNKEEKREKSAKKMKKTRVQKTKEKKQGGHAQEARKRRKQARL